MKSKRATIKQTAKQLVNDHAEELQSMTPGELWKFGRDHGFDNGPRFREFKWMLLSEIGVNYVALVDARQAERQAS